MKKLSFLIWGVSGLLLHGQETQLQEFNMLLEEATEIATKSKLNVDYVPGTVSIITGEELKSYGVTNLAQLNSMDMIVGFETVTSSLRGTGPMYGAVGNKIKWMINGKVLETETRDTDDWAKGSVLFPFSVDQVDRIEVIRGPGSAIYGGNAIFGVVNIITKKENQSAFGSLEYLRDSNYGYMGGANTFYQGEEYSINLSFSGYHSDGDHLEVDTDGLFWRDWGRVGSSTSSPYVPGYAPGDLPNQNEGYSFLGDIDYLNLHFWLYRFEVGTGQGHQSWYPTDSFPPDDGTMVKIMTHTMTGLEWDVDLYGWSVTPEVGMTILDNPANDYFKNPAGAYGFTFDAYRKRQYREEKYYSQIEATKKFDDHRWLMGAFLQDSEIKKAEMQINYDFSNRSDDTWYSYNNGFFPERKGRRQMAFYVQDEWDVSEDVRLTMGTRYDEYSDVDNAMSPRVAMVYRHDLRNIYKVQFSRAFRAPSLFEAYGYVSHWNKYMKPERADTFEIGYIRKHSVGDFKVTLFHTVMDEMVIQGYASYIYENLSKKARIQGVEFEHTWIGEWIEVFANLALYDSLNMLEKEPFVDAAGITGNLKMTLAARSELPTTVWLHFIGEKPRSQGGESKYAFDNGVITSQQYLNISQKYKNLMSNLELEYGIRNLLNQTQVVEYMPQELNTNDIPYMGQSFWVNAVYKF